MPRPRKTDEERRTEMLVVRLTPDERIGLEAEAETLSLSLAALARLRLSGRLSLRTHRRLHPSHALALGRVGVNLNQIARSLNSREAVPDALIASALKELRAVLAEIVAASDIADAPSSPDGPTGKAGRRL